uniref:Hpt domain-containing protein n=2 Tax=Candidatus Electrothrix sp. TaxID=2170559 RepID=UPI004056808F
MDSSMGNEIVIGFIGEVEGYVPDMSRCLQTLQQDRTHRPSLTELHRITHTIKGAAAMVGLDDLSDIGEVLEKVMENLLDSSLDLDDEIITLLGDATGRIESYCAMQREGRPDDGHLLLQPIAKIEEKTLKNISDSNKSEGDSAENNPELLHFDREEEDLFRPEAEAFDQDEPAKLDKNINSDAIDDLFAEDESKSFEETGDTDSLFDEIFDEIPSASLQQKTPTKENGISFIETEQDSQELPESVPIDPELLECFQEETEEHLENIDRCLNSLEEHTTDLITLTPSSQETLHSLRRSVHTLKGAAAVIGIEQVAAWGHDFEDFLDWLHDEAQQLDPTTLAALRDGSDLLASLAETPGLAIAKEKQRITTQFEDIIKQFSSHPVGPDKQEAETKTSSFIAEEPDEADSFFDEFSSLPSETEEEDDLFASALAGLSEHPEKSDNLF